MKTKLFSKLVAWVIFSFLGFFSIQNVSAQIPCSANYDIINTSNCTIKVDYLFMCNGSGCVGGGSGLIAANGGSFTIVPPGACTGCSNPNGCDVRVWLIEQGGTAISGNPSVDSGNPNNTFTPTGGCTSAGSINWQANQTIIN